MSDEHSGALDAFDLARTFVHSVVLTLALVLIVIVQQYLLPGIIPAFAGGN